MRQGEGETARKRRRRVQAHRRRFFERARAPVRGTQGEGATCGATSEGREAGGWLCSPSLSAGRREGRNDRTCGALARSRAEPRWRSHDGWCAVMTRCAVMDDPATIRGAFARSRDRAFARLSRSRRRGVWFDGRCARGERTSERSNDRTSETKRTGACHPSRTRNTGGAQHVARVANRAPKRRVGVHSERGCGEWFGGGRSIDRTIDRARRIAGRVPFRNIQIFLHEVVVVGRAGGEAIDGRQPLAEAVGVERAAPDRRGAAQPCERVPNASTRHLPDAEATRHIQPDDEGDEW